LQTIGVCEITGVSAMYGMLVAKLGEPKELFPQIALFKRPRHLPQFRRGVPRMDEALKAGIGATVCSVIILTIMFAVLQALPVSIG
jgi:hypothetical protein